MNLLELKGVVGNKGIEKLAIRTDLSPRFLELICCGDRQPSEDACRRLIAADPRLTLADLRPDLFGKPAPPVQSALDKALMSFGIRSKKRA